MMEQKTQKKLFRRAYERSARVLKNAVLGTAFALGIGAAAVACGGRPGVCDNGSPYCYPSGQDAGLVQKDGASQHDARNDAIQFDVIIPQTDGGVDGPLPPQYSYTMNNLIGDYLNRDLKDRDKGAKDYPMNVPLTDPNANPFSDGAGGNLGPSQTAMHRVSQDNFLPFATSTLTDPSAAKSYIEQQDLWVSGDSHYSDTADSVVGHINFVSYTLKFKGESDDFGIPVCTTPTGMDYTTCKSGGTSFRYATESHKLSVKFLGDDWIVSEMSPPTTTLASENMLIGGGYVKFAKEAISRILNQGEAITVDDLKFRLDGLEVHGSTTVAVISILDANDNVLKKDTIAPGATKEFVINGKTYLLHCYNVAPDYSIAKWANVALLSKELKLMHGQKLDPDYDNNKYWTVSLGWENKGASATDMKPDHLRSIILYADDISHLSSGGSQDLLPGDYIPIVQDPVAFKLGYMGLYVPSPDTYNSLSFDLERNAPYAISATYGPNGQACTISVPYLKVTSSQSGSVFQITGASNDTFYIAANGGNCSNTTFGPGAVFMHQTPSSSKFVLQAMPVGGENRVEFPTAADSTGANGGFIRVLTPQQMGYPELDPPLKVAVAVVESAGEGIAADSLGAMGFPVKAAGSLSSLNSDVYGTNNGQLFKKDTIRYDYAGPVSSGIYFADEGFVTERGSRFTQILDTNITYSIAGQILYTRFILTKD